MKTLIDQSMIRTLTYLSEMVLRRYFFYDWEGIDIFNKHFAKVINGEHTNLYLNATDEFKNFIWGNQDAQQKFTANFLGFYLLDTLHKALKFNEMELIHFESILFEHLKEVEPVERAQEYSRTNDRNPFAPL
jgi:hypothetical protein